MKNIKNKIDKLNKTKFGLIEVLVMILIIGVIVSFSTLFIYKKSNPVADLSGDKALRSFLETYASVVTGYYEELDREELVGSAIKGMMNYLGDDYSVYLNEDSASDLDSSLSGKYEGVGIQITTGNIIISVFENSPASKAGLKVNDVITKINDVDVSTMKTDEVANLIKTSENDKIEIVVKRAEEELTFTVTREKINTPSVTSSIKEENNQKIGYIIVSTFSATTAEQFLTELNKVEKQGINSLIIDLRDNTGGLLSSATEIASLFIEKGKVIYSLENKNGVETTKDKTKAKRDYKMAILTNGASASASEVLAAALKESYGAILVGQTTYGKGKVQQKTTLSNDTMIKFTTSKWLTPKGNNIDGVGLIPDYEVKIDESFVPKSSNEDEYLQEYAVYKEHVAGVYNLQLQKAIEILSK